MANVRQARLLTRDDLRIFAERVANKPSPPDDEAKAVLAIAQAAVAEIKDAKAIRDNQTVIIRVLGEASITLRKANGDSIVDGGLEAIDVGDNIKSTDDLATATKKALCNSRDKLLEKWIKSRPVDANVDQGLVDEAKAATNDAMQIAINGNGQQPYGIQVSNDGGIPADQKVVYAQLQKAAREKITAILEKKLIELKEDKLAQLNAVIAEGTPVKALNKGVLVTALNHNDVKGAGAVDINDATLTDEQFQHLVTVAGKRAKKLVQDKILGVPAAISVTQINEDAQPDAKNAFIALLNVNHAVTADGKPNTKAVLMDDKGANGVDNNANFNNGVGLKLAPLDAVHVGALDEKIYPNADIKNDTQKALIDFMVKVIKERADHFNDEDSIQAVHDALDANTPVAKLSAINALEPFATWRGNLALAGADVTPAFETALREAVNAREESNKLAGDKTILNRIVRRTLAGLPEHLQGNPPVQVRVHDALYDALAHRPQLRILLLNETVQDGVVKQLKKYLQAKNVALNTGYAGANEADINAANAKIIEPFLRDVLQSSDALSAKKALLALGVPKDVNLGNPDITLDSVAKQIAEQRQVETETLAGEAKSLHGRGGIIGSMAISPSTWLSVTGKVWEKIGPSKQQWENAGVGEKILRGGQAAIVAVPTVATGVVAGACAIVTNVLHSPFYAYSSAKQVGVIRDFDEIDKTLAGLQNEIEKAKGSKDPAIQTELTNSLQHILARLQSAKGLYDKDTKSIGDFTRYSRYSSACQARINKIGELKQQLTELKMEPDAKYEYTNEVKTVDLNNPDEIKDAAQRLFNAAPAAVAGFAEINGRMRGTVEKDDFNDMRKGILMKLEVGTTDNLGNSVTINSTALIIQKSDGKAETRILSSDGTPFSPQKPNPYIGMGKNDWPVISWAVEAVNAQLQRAKDKTGIMIVQTSPPQFTQAQIAAMFIYCARIGVTCGPKTLYDVTNKEMEQGKKDQLKAIEQHFAARPIEMPSTPADEQTMRTAMTRRLDELADRAKYYGKEETAKFTATAADKPITSLRGPGRSGGG